VTKSRNAASYEEKAVEPEKEDRGRTRSRDEYLIRSQERRREGNTERFHHFPKKIDRSLEHHEFDCPPANSRYRGRSFNEEGEKRNDTSKKSFFFQVFSIGRETRERGADGCQLYFMVPSTIN